MMIFRSLPFKINTAIVITAVTVSVFFLLILYPLELKRSEEQLKRIHLLLETVLQQKINNLANELFAKQERALRATIREINTVDDIVGIDIYGEDGNLFLASNNDLNDYYSTAGIKKIDSVAVFETFSIGDQSYGVYSSTIEVIGKKIGYIVMYYDLSTLKSESRRALAIILILPVAIILLMGVLLNFFLFRSIIKPVSILRNAMRKVEQGKLGETVELSGRDEIGDMSSAFNDMSRKMRENNKALIEAEAKYRSIFENAIEGIFQYTVANGLFITVNPSMASILGYASSSDLIETNRHVKDLIFAHDGIWLQLNETLLASGRLIGFETELLRKDGNTVWVSISIQRVFDEGQKPLYDEGSCIDITEQRQRVAAEQEREAAESASKAKSFFLATMSHEIRTPLNAILGFADILESTIFDDKRKNYINIIQSSGANLLSLINDIIDLSKVEAGKIDIRHTTVNFRSVIDELVNLFSVKAQQKGIEISAFYSGYIPHYLMTDGARLRQILFNLMGNAVKFTGEGHVHIQCTAEKADEEGAWNIEISVEDTGSGITEDALKSIFDTFQQHDIPGKISEGSGLGLAITKNLIEMMNGDIRVESDHGVGSTFTVTLNSLMEAEHGQERDEYPTHEVNLTVERVFDPACILIVDDLEVNRQHLKTSLKGSQFTIIEADNGYAAEKMAQKYNPDLILMDIFMPVADGYEAIVNIRKNMDRYLPIVAITAAGMKEDIAKIRESGFDDYLIRPFNRHQLLEKISLFLQNSVVSSPVKGDKSYVFVEKQASLKPLHYSTWQCTKEVADFLRAKVSDKWLRICKKRRIPDILLFAEEISELGRKNSVDALITYGSELRDHAENVDVDLLQKCLEHYTDFLDLMIIR